MKLHRIYLLLCYTGVFFMIYSFLTLILVGVSVILDEFEIVYPLIFPTLIILFSGVGLYFLFRKWRYAEMKLNTAMMLAGLAWFIIPFLGTIPFYISGNLDFLSAFFESMSGFTTTGLTMYVDVESLPRTILFWRSLTQWVGGIGLLALFVIILSKRSPALRKLYTAEGRTDVVNFDERTDVVNFDVIRTSRGFLIIYVSATLLCVLLLYVVGLPIFDSLNAAFTALATGGFSIRNGSIGSYGNFYAEVILMVFLIIGATNFFYMAGLFRRANRNIEFEAFLIIISISIFMLLVVGKLSPRISTFQAISAMTTCGFQTTALNGFSDFSKIILTMLMIMGGSSGSTAGGIKIFRVVIIFFILYWYLKKLNLPKGATFTQRIGEKTFSDKDIIRIIPYVATYLTFLLMGALIFTACGHSLTDSTFEVASAIGNTGLSVGLTSISLSALEKCVLILEMWMGRIEILAALLLLTYPVTSVIDRVRR